MPGGFFLNSCRSAYLGFSRRGNIHDDASGGTSERRLLFPSLSGKCDWVCTAAGAAIYFHKSAKNHWTTLIFVRELVLCQCCCLMSRCFVGFDTHCAEDLEITLLFGGSHLGGEMEEVWPKWNILLYMSVVLCNLKGKHAAWTGCPLRFRQTLRRELLWIWSKCQVRCAWGKWGM